MSSVRQSLGVTLGLSLLRSLGLPLGVRYLAFALLEPVKQHLLPRVVVVVVFSTRTDLVALIAFMPTNPNNDLGSLDYKKEERRTLAIKFRYAALRFGTLERQKLIDEVLSFHMVKWLK
nr:ubiquitin-conjugating enzyme E2 32 isoform X2 [Arachis hypogaea]